MSTDQTTLWLRIGRSRWLLSYLLVSHALAGIVLYTLPILLGWQLLAIASIVVSLYFHLGRQQWWHNHANQRAIIGIRRAQAGYWQCDFTDGTVGLPYQFISSFVLPTIVIVRLQAAFDCRFYQRYRTVIFLKDTTNRQDLRQLRMWLIQQG